MERRTITGESAESAHREVEALLQQLRDDDPEFEVSARLIFARPPYETPPDHALTTTLAASAAANGIDTTHVAMSFWTDAAVLGEAGIPSVLFGPSGAGLHSVEEYVDLQSVVACRDVLADVAMAWLE
jgi:acetylornithine deacetylase